MWILISHVKGRTQTEGFWKQGAKENILDLETEDITEMCVELHNLYGLTNITSVMESR
jgi:hypothetical protein